MAGFAFSLPPAVKVPPQSSHENDPCPTCLFLLLVLPICRSRAADWCSLSDADFVAQYGNLATARSRSSCNLPGCCSRGRTQRVPFNGRTFSQWESWSSSCHSCHGQASGEPSGTGMIFFSFTGPVGALSGADLPPAGYPSLDFVRALANAQSRSPRAPKDFFGVCCVVV